VDVVDRVDLVGVKPEDVRLVHCRRHADTPTRRHAQLPLSLWTPRSAYGRLRRNIPS
jgi:hypothetical protein